uniref:DDE Tnp4 domain-containing protein n=1 Tax=Cacopsylla melanoneura TaxID=428564 RepID=A0A8D9AJR4_9HEMI
MDNFVLLADSGYGIEPSLMTPYRTPMENDEIAFNNLLKKERVIIERCFGQVKRRFPILQYMVRVKLDRVPRIIVCCFILHNIAKYLQDEEFLESEEVYFNEPNIEENILSETDLKILGERKRRQLSQVISRQQL